MGLAAKNPGKTWLQRCCWSHSVLMGARVRGQSFRCPCHGVPGGQDPQEEVWPGVHTHCSAPTPTLLPWSQEKHFGSSWQDTTQGKPQASGPAGHHSKPLLYPMQIQDVTSHHKNPFTATLAPHLPRKCSGQVCPERASTYRAGELSSPSEKCCFYSTTLMPVTP